MNRLSNAFLLLSVALVACSREAPTPAATQAQPAATVAAPTNYTVTDWVLPVTDGAQPDLIAAADGGLLLSWIEKDEGAHALRFARSTPSGWETPRTIATGNDWFVNWADTPHIASTADGALWAHWLRKSAAATYAYDVVLSRSADGGETWSAPLRVNDDGTPTEHGFVSVWPAARDQLGIAWLDGRNTGGGEGHHGGGGMMTLRSARFDAVLARHDEVEVDASTCDCCQTSVALTTRGPLLVYRDRTVGEIRDISAARWQDAAWTAPRPVHADGWKMPACPVNGPSAEARGNDVRVAWYTAADGGVPEIRHARSLDAGDAFDAPLTVDRGPEVLGRVATALDGEATWLAWLREDEASGQTLWAARVAGTPARVQQRLKVASLQGRGRGTGVPQVVVQSDRLHIAWTDLVDGAPRLRGATIDLR